MEDGGGRKDTEGEGKWNTQKIVENGGAGFSLDVTLAMEPKFGAVPEQGWNTTTSQFGYTAWTGGQTKNKNNNRLW